VSAFPEVILILLLLMATLAWVLIYFFVVERWLQRYVGNISALPSVVRLMETRVDAHTKFYVSGWRITAPQSACRLFDIFIWFVGGVFRSLVIGVPAAACY